MKEIKAKNGCYITQNMEVLNEERLYLTSIKGVSVNESDWREASQEEKDAFEKEQDEIQQTEQHNIG